MAKPRVAAFGYRAALRWLAFNDDCEWLDDENGAASVTAAFVADCYGKADSQVRDDLRRTVARVEKERESDNGNR